MDQLPITGVDHLATDVLPVGTAYPEGFLLERHKHRRAQLLYGASGVMEVVTDDGSWTVPTDRAVLIPPETGHEVRMHAVTTWSLYIEPDAVPWWPRRCTVVEVGPLLRELLRAAAELDPEYEASGRDGTLMKLLLEELQRVSPAPFAIFLPSEEPFRTMCRDYLAAPDLAVTSDTWARAAAMSRTAFDRRFREVCDMSPGAWRSRARLLASLPLLGSASVTAVAGRLGYATPAAFSAAFRRAFGVQPSHFR